MPHRQLILALILLLPGAVSAQIGAPGQDYMQLSMDETGAPVSLQTPIIAFEDAGRGLRVDLVGAIHVGDAAYFADLNERFAGYDAVLYELVAAEDARPDPNAAPGNLVSGMQLGITKLLDLEFQLNEIDYTAANFVHADLTPGELAQSMNERDESMLTYFSRLLAASLDDYDVPALPAGSPGLFATLFSPDRPRLLKIMFAYSMLDVEGFSRIIEGDNGSSLVGDRNARAVAVLNDRIDAGDREIAIFYGVAHLPDLAARLTAEIGLTPGELTWIEAWDLRASP